MKLRSLDIEHFGIFSGQSLEFDAGFSLVYGPNEAGKSTLLQLIRELLFGFKPLQNPYVFDDHSGELAATAAFEVSDGTQLRFRRRKGKKNEVVGTLEPTGREIDAAGLSGLLGGAGKELYEQVFGFSLRELTEADESLKRANLTEALYGGGLGGLANFQKVQAELQAEADGLFTPRGRSKQLIHKLLGDIKEQTKELKNQTLKPRDFEQLVREVKEAAADVESKRLKLEELRTRKAHVDRVADALEPWLRQRHAERELAKLNVPAAFPIDGGEQFKRLKTRRNEIATELAADEQELAEESDQLATLQLAPELVANEAAIRELEQQIKQIVGYRRDLPLRQQDSDSIKTRVLAALRDFSPDWDHKQLERFRTSLVQRETIERLKSELEDIRHERGAATAARGAVQADIKKLEKQLDRAEQQDAPDGLASLLEQATIYERNLERLNELRSQIADADARLHALVAKLNSPLRSKLAEGVELHVPLAATVSEFRERLKHSQTEVDEAGRRVKSTEHELEQRREQLAQLDASSAVPDRERLLAARDDRDVSWQLIHKRLLNDKTASDDEIAEWVEQHRTTVSADLLPMLASVYEESVSAADALADERQDKAEQAATCDQLKHEVNRLEKRLAADRERLDSHSLQHAATISQWEALWSDCPFMPLSPDAMLDWLSVFDELLEARSKRKQLAQRAETLRTTIAQFETDLATAFPSSSQSPSQQLVRARELHEAARDAIVRRRTYEEQVPQKQEALRTLDEQITGIDARHRDWQTRWEQLLDQFEFPREWDVHLASKILGGLVEARNDWDRAVEFDKRVGDMTSGIATFQSAVQLLCEQLAPALAEFAPEVAMKELQTRLDAAKSAQRDHARLLASRTKLLKRQAAKQEQLSKIDTEINELLAAADTRNDAEFEQVAIAAKRRAELSQVCSEAASEINTIRRTEDEAKFVLELTNADSDSIAAEQSRIRSELTKAEAEANAALKKETLLDEQRKQLDGASRAADLALDLESTRSQLAATVDRWAPLVLAQALMKQSIKKFEREHQPAMLAEVERLFGRMTLGRYTAIERKLDEHGTLLVVDEAGQRKEPHQLSTGTREQLYLAIRLAYIHHYCQDAEPLPIVMDDVLVNFDAERARQTLSVFAEVADHVQIIFLTCHQHMMELVGDVLPAARAIILPGGKLSDGLVVAARSQRTDTLATKS
ncbi:MAG: AAA family ATPase [Planctomycetota bacterium]